MIILSSVFWRFLEVISLPSVNLQNPVAMSEDAKGHMAHCRHKVSMVMLTGSFHTQYYKTVSITSSQEMKNLMKPMQT